MPKIPPAINGGTTYPKHYKVPKVKTSTSPIAPPPFTYNPTVGEEGQKAATEEANRLHEFGREKHFNETDLHTGLRNIRTDTSRNRMDYGKENRRGNEKLDRELRHGNEKLGRERQSGEERLNNEQSDTERNASRRLADYQTKRNNITREFGELGHRQAEAQNATGTLDSGTSAAAAAARARNQQLAEAPITTEEGRTREDLATALGRLGTNRQHLGEEITRAGGELGEETGRARGELGEDYGTSINRLNQDRDRQRGELHQKIGRSEHQLGEKEQEVKQAGVEAKQNTLTNEIWEFKENHPAAFAKWSKAHPAAAAAAEGTEPGAGKGLGNGALSAPPSKNGGTQAPRNNNRRKKNHRKNNKKRRR